MRQLILVLFVSAWGLSLLTGCQESDAKLVRRAKVIGSENLKLKEDLKEKDRQIDDLEKQIAELEAKNAKEHEQFGDTTLKTLQMMAETENRNQALTAENEKLKDEIEKLKAK